MYGLPGGSSSAKPKEQEKKLSDWKNFDFFPKKKQFIIFWDGTFLPNSKKFVIFSQTEFEVKLSNPKPKNKKNADPLKSLL